jgi:hypothetical protein
MGSAVGRPTDLSLSKLVLVSPWAQGMATLLRGLAGYARTENTLAKS